MYLLSVRCTCRVLPVAVAAVFYAFLSFAPATGFAQSSSVSGEVDPDFIADELGLGGLDDPFNPKGTAQATLQQPDGKVLIVGSQIYGIDRLNEDGTIDTTFKVGAGTDGTVSAVILQPDGSIVIGGEFTSYNGSFAPRLIRLKTDGSLDTTYTPQVNAPVRALVLLSSGKVMVGGEFTMVNGVSANSLVRLNLDGTTDPTFNSSLGADGPVYALAEHPDGSGRMLVGGSFNNLGGTALANVGQINADGSADPTFNPDVVSTSAVNARTGSQPQGTGPKGTNGTVHVVKYLKDRSGTVLVGGAFSQVGSFAQTGLVRVLATGKVDSGFVLGVGPLAQRRKDAAGILQDTGISGGMATVYSLDLQEDGKVVFGGGFSQVAGVSRNNLVRVESDGTVDQYYSSGTGPNASVHSIALRSDGKAHVAGSFSKISDYDRNTVGRLTSDTGTAAFFDGQVQVGEGFFYLQFPNGNPFGYYNVSGNGVNFPFMYHADLGFEYFLDASDGHSGAYLYDFASNTFWYTSPTFPFPYLYDFTLNAFLYYYPDPNNTGHYNTNGVRYFYNFSTSQIISK